MTSLMDWSDLIDIYQRLDSTIMFTLIRFVYAVMDKHASAPEITLFCILAVLTAGIVMRWPVHRGTALMAQVIFSLASALFSQAVINIATHNSRLMSQNVQSAVRLLLDFVTVTSLLLGAAILPEQVRILPYINRAITLLLYMYTDATEYMIAQLSLGIAPTFLCIFLYMLVIRFRTQLQEQTTLEYLLKALNMVSINIVLSSAGTISSTLTDRHTEAVLIVIILFIIDAMHRVSGALQEGRDFAVWKGSQKLFTLYVDINVNSFTTFTAAVLFLIAKHVMSSTNSTLVEVMLLVTINVILDDLSQYTAYAYNMDKVFILFIYVIAIHSIKNAMPTPKK